jgi:uncharacterized protein (TIGR03435 family)
MSRTGTVLALVLLVNAGLPAQEQTPGDLPAFEVISIKPRTGDTPAGGIPNSPDRFVRPNVTSAQLIEYAYEVRGFQIIGGPGWLQSERFAVSAKAETAPSAAQMRLMVRRLLAERFGLAVRSETREMPIYALVTAQRDGRLGDKMKPSDLDCGPMIDSGKIPPRTPGGPPTCAWFVALLDNGPARLRLNGIRVPRFASVLEPMAIRKIVDRTGLTGTYDIEMEFLPDPGLLGLRVPNATPQQTLEIPPLLTAIQDQLGLKLETERGPVEVIVVERAQLPTPD